jgi:hypothetical protein
MGDQATSIPAEEMTVQVQQMAAALQAVQAELARTQERLFHGEGQRQEFQTARGAEFNGERAKFPIPKGYGGSKVPGAVENFLFDCEQYFKAVPMVDKKAVLFAATLLEGSGKTWYRYRVEQAARGYLSEIETWVDFKKELTSRFQAVNAVRAARDRLANIRQEKTVRGYVKAFQNLVMQIPDITNAEALDRFVRGLKPRTKHEVVMREPCNLEEAIHLADWFDSLISGLGTPSRPGGFYIQRTQPEPTQVGQGLGPVPIEVDTMNGGRSRRTPLTATEREKLIRTGGCFYCRKTGHMIGECPYRTERPANGRVQQLENGDDSTMRDEGREENDQPQ